MAVQEARPIARATLGQIENRLPDVRGSQLTLLISIKQSTIL